MQSKEQLKQAIKNSMVNKFERICDFREIQTLPKIIDNDEYIVQAVNGFFSRNHSERYSLWSHGGSNGTGLIILTNKEVILYNHSLFMQKISPSIPLRQLHSITPSSGILYGYIDFDDGSSHPFRASHILAWKCNRFKQAVDEQISRLQNRPAYASNQQYSYNNRQYAYKQPVTQNQYYNNQQTQTNQSGPVNNPVQELSQLYQMYQNHQITLNDYEQMKAKIIQNP